MSPSLNRLSTEKSPYLRQHAHNPVNWYPWGPEAFERARRENKPVLVSIGYSTCHWCHVMERESFENEAVAALMNEHLVCIKVDREERPDVDRLYMTAVQTITGQGGWPLNVFLAPTGEPFVGGTYFPPEDRGGRIGWMTLLERISRAWRDPAERERLTDSGARLLSVLGDHLREELPSTGDLPVEECLRSGFVHLREGFDLVNGGFGVAPKFPLPVNLRFLLRYSAWARSRPEGEAEAESALEMVRKTLSAMSSGGLWDALGGGFHRYSTDERWFLPHFEKMLYDNAQLAAVALDATQATGDASFAEIARGTLDYLRRDMTTGEGGFCSAEDADSAEEGAVEKREGAFYVWASAEIDDALGGDADFFRSCYGVASAGNVAMDPHGDFSGRNVLSLVRPPLGPGEAARLDAARRRLLALRGRRPRPQRDDKVLAAWNGLALTAFARGAWVLDDPAYLESARRAADFLFHHLWDASERRLYRRWCDGERAVPGQADDHAFLIQGLVDLFEASGEVRWLDWARELAEIFQKSFLDDGGRVYMTASAEDLPLRLPDEWDNVEPSSAAVAAGALARLARLTDREDFRTSAGKIRRVLTATAAREPRGHAYGLSVLAEDLLPTREVVVAGDPADPAVRALLDVLRRRFLPSTIILRRPVAGESAPLPILAPLRVASDRAAATVCDNQTCRPPAYSPEDLVERLASSQIT
jgi:uncharacterized protein YyaL (SSP411 family)